MTDSLAAGWFSAFVADVQGVSPSATSESVLEGMLRFRKETVRKVHLLDGQYPSERAIRGWPGQKDTCDFRYGDFLLTYWEAAVPNVPPSRSRTLQDIIDRIEGAAAPWTTQSSVLGILAEETARRGAMKLPKKQNLWAATAQHISDKYAGFYLMLRPTSFNKITAELFCIQKVSSPKDETGSGGFDVRVAHSIHQCSVRFLWDCEDDLWVGDLIIGSDKLAGVALKREIRHLPNPTTVYIMRHRQNLHQPHGRNLPFGLRPVLTGVIVGWNSRNSDEFFQSVFAIEKLNTKLEPTLENFTALTKSEHKFNALQSLTADGHEWDGRKELESIFLERKKIHGCRTCQEAMAETTVVQNIGIDGWLTGLL